MRYQPQGAVRLNRSNPLARGLVFAIVHGTASASGYIGQQKVFQYTAASSTLTSPLGTGVRVNSAPLNAGAYSFGSPISGNSYSLLAVGTATDLSGSSVQNAIDSDDAASARRFQFRIDAGRVNIIPFNTGGGVTGNAIFPTALTAAEAARGFVMGATVSPTEAAAWQNGNKATAAASNTVGLSSSDAIAIGTMLTKVQLWKTGALSMVAGWNRVLSDDEMRSLAANPWQLFDAPEDDDYLVVASTPTNSTGTFAATLAAPSMASAGLLTIPGALSPTLAAPTFAASGIAATPPSGTFSASMPAPVMTSTGVALDAGSFSATMPAPTFAAIGTAAPNVTGTLAFTMPAPTMSAFGFLGAVAPAAPVKPYRWRILRRGFASS